jgi:hypothetical protein
MTSVTPIVRPRRLFVSVNAGSGPMPARQYAVKVTSVNVGKAVTLTLAEGINVKKCSLEAKGGYLNEPSCAIAIPSAGQGFNVNISFAGDPYSQATIKLVEVVKER